ncbi:DNA repair protein [Lactiplantibacillus garii]|uniref:DNA repair protein n=1 Tax=Lactiplantibacillus garii TaxID=2306423 RepID=A0A3R8KJP1_9LACO|nr:JAB domain-containing protein [Lactiplantibacillus garii]RRK11139.1 DNA repair protein [Lactiplantibacillus garii]
MTSLTEQNLPLIQIHALIEQYFATFLTGPALKRATHAFERTFPPGSATTWLNQTASDPLWNGLLIALRCGQLLPHPNQVVVGQIYGSQQTGAQLAHDFANWQQERLLLLCLDTKNQIVKRQVVFQGTLNSCPAHPREIMQTALTVATARIVIAHNHPSGDVTPSKKDVEFTKRLQLAGEIVGVPLLDSFVIGANDYFSFAEQGLVNCNTDSQ